MIEVEEHLRERYFTDAKFAHLVNALANIMASKTLSPNEMDEALSVAKAKYYLDAADEAAKYLLQPHRLNEGDSK